MNNGSSGSGALSFAAVLLCVFQISLTDHVFSHNGVACRDSIIAGCVTNKSHASHKSLASHVSH